MLQRRAAHPGPGILCHTGVFFFGGLFRHDFAENGPHDLKLVWKDRRVSQFYTICDKNQLQDKNVEKFLAILVPRSWDVSCQVARAENPVHAPADWSCIWRPAEDRDLKMSCIDASQRQLKSALQIRH
jgi:hypothetical protein